MRIARPGLRGATACRCLCGFLLLMMLGLGGCSAVGDDGCRSSSDCSGEEECAAPYRAPVCGIPARFDCMRDADCLDEMRCQAASDPCSPTGLGTVCAAPCEEGSCGAGLRCNASGSCEAQPCGADFACAAPLRCDVTRAGLTDHGCVLEGCSRDEDCEAQEACVNGGCQEGPGSCEVPMAVP